MKVVNPRTSVGHKKWFSTPPKVNMRIMIKIFQGTRLQITLFKFPKSNFTRGQHTGNNCWLMLEKNDQKSSFWGLKNVDFVNFQHWSTIVKLDNWASWYLDHAACVLQNSEHQNKRLSRVTLSNKMKITKSNLMKKKKRGQNPVAVWEGRG